MIRKWRWWQSGGFEFGIGQHIDGLAVMLLFLVAFISLLVQIYSIEYVSGDRRYTHFFAAITLFSAGMLVMVLAENMVQLILGWEIMGLCSFLLIGHWWEDEAQQPGRAEGVPHGPRRRRRPARRNGDPVLRRQLVDPGEPRRVRVQHPRHLGVGAVRRRQRHASCCGPAIALFIACIGKSGQFPLHTWLPDAMAGPTPVSSLLHSSTMVVAGVFLVARLYPVFWEGLDILGSRAST